MEILQIFPWDNIRLPTFAHPTRYNITMHPNLTTLEFRGKFEKFCLKIKVYLLYITNSLCVFIYRTSHNRILRR